MTEQDKKYEYRRLRSLELLRSECGGKQVEFARRTGIEPSYVSRMLYPEGKPGRKRIGEDVGDLIEKSFGLDRGALSSPTPLSHRQRSKGTRNQATDLSTMAGRDARISSNVSAGPEVRGRVPLISWVQAGRFSEIADLLQPGEALDWIPTTAPIARATFALRVEGDSMEPEFPPGMIIIVEPEMEAVPGDYVIAKQGDEATFKQLIRDGSDLLLKPLNERYPIKPLGTAQIIGVVRASHRTYR